MKTWKRYKGYLLKGEWHIHTSYTDGRSSVAEYCKKAWDLHIPLIAFTEHVREDLSYSFDKFLRDIEKARDVFPEIIILSGCEAKVLPDGELDVSEENLRKVDYPIFAFHSFPPEFDLYLKCLRKVIKNEFINAWAHPGLFLKKHNLEMDDGTLIDILRLVGENDVLLEVNRKYDLPPKYWSDFIGGMGIHVVRGSDIHSASELSITDSIVSEVRSG